MAKLIERTVQNAAIEWLAEYYKGKARKKRIYYKMETRTKKKYGGKRADGLLVFRKRFRRGVYVVSMESKSYKTQKVITPRRDNKKWIGNSLFYGAFISLGSGVFLFASRIEDLSLSLAYILGLLIAISFIIGWLTRNWAKHKTMDVLSQIEQYPGNEQWLSTSKDSYDAVPVKLQAAFLKVVKARGVGLLLVNRRKKVICINKPEQRSYWGFKKNGFLSYYSLEEEIMKYLK